MFTNTNKIYKKLIKEWHPTKNGKLKISDLSLHSHKEIYWKCPVCGHEWLAVFRERIKGHRNCKKCRSLGVKYPELAKEWHLTKNGNLTPYDIFAHSGKKAIWKCKKNHEWLAVINSRSGTQKSDCPFCSNSSQSVCRDNCLATLNPELAKEWHPTKNGKLTPYDVRPYSNKKVWWQCPKCKMEWQSIINFRNKKQSPCVYCSNEKLHSRNCLAFFRPDLIKEWHPTKNGKLTPYDVFAQSNKKAQWICSKKHEWATSPNSRNNKNPKKHNNCPFCANKKVCKDNCLATLCPELAKEWHPTKNRKLTPNNTTPGSKRKVHWKCRVCGNEWKAIIQARYYGNGCPLCCKIVLKDGATCDSLVEAFFYLKYKKEKRKFKYHGLYGFGHRIYDFYFPKQNKYIEVSGYSPKQKRWKNYFKKIREKRNYVEKTLHAKFEFICYILTTKERQYVRSHIA